MAIESRTFTRYRAICDACGAVGDTWQDSEDDAINEVTSEEIWGYSENTRGKLLCGRCYDQDCYPEGEQYVD